MIYGSDWEVGFTEAFNTISNMMGIIESADILLEGEGSTEQKEKLSERIKEGFNKIAEAVKKAFVSFCKTIKEKCNDAADKLTKWYEEHNISRVLVDQYVKNWDYKKEIEEIDKIIKNNPNDLKFIHINSYELDKLTGYTWEKFFYDDAGMEKFKDKIRNNINEIRKSNNYSDAQNLYNNLSIDCKDMTERIKNSDNIENIFLNPAYIRYNDKNYHKEFLEFNNTYTNADDIETIIEFIESTKKRSNNIRKAYKTDIEYFKYRIKELNREIKKDKDCFSNSNTMINSTTENNISLKNYLLADQASLQLTFLEMKYRICIKKLP